MRRDDKQVSGVRLSITNGSGQYWNGSGFTATATTVNATVSGSGTPSATWSYMMVGAPAGTYTVNATAVDASNNADASPATRGFTTGRRARHDRAVAVGDVAARRSTRRCRCRR